MWWYIFIVPVAFSYIIFVRSIRYRRVKQIQKKYGSTPAQFKNLNYRDAQTILGQLGLFECPWVFLAGKDFAFLRVGLPGLKSISYYMLFQANTPPQAFAIPGISKVSVGAREMIERVGKRYADTTVLVGEFLVNDIDSERACIAINRMNWIHSRYGNKIQMDQMVYTLCLLTCEALHWIDKYDWRKTVALEKHASWVFWNEVGLRMGLENVPQNFEACAAFITVFETRNMAPSNDNALIAEGIFSLYASTVPTFLSPVVRAVLIAFMDTQLVTAFKLSSPPLIASSYVQSSLCFALAIRKQFVRYLMLPRYSSLQVFGEENATGYRNMMFWEIQPWYVASATSCSWFYSTYMQFFKLPMAGDSSFRPEGYKLQEIGPLHYEGKGGQEVMSFVKTSQGCSFTTFGQFSNTVHTRAGCPMNDTKYYDHKQ